MLEIEDLAVDLPRRAANAVLSITGGKSRTLRRTLSDRLGAPAGSPDSLVAEPMLEGAHPWLLHPGGWSALPDSLHPDAGQVLRSRMGHPPYAHQVETWALASAPEPSSIIISSGTGSGKTECFLGALLNHLLIASNGGSRSLTGVRGLMLYPLNALINSQQERLSAWLSPFGGRLRFCLYNGLTPEGPSAEAERQRTPEQILDRKALRASPPPLLVTNLTMLEYMLVRRQDAPILEQSRGLLEYVVLDEVHTYIGAQATELALLLRRVALAFGRDPRTIRVIATSATLGTGDRGEKEEQLRQFLRDLTGAAGTAHAVIGERAQLDLPVEAAVERLARAVLDKLPDEAAWERLAPAPRLQAIARRLHSDERIRWSEWRDVARDTLAPEADIETGARALLAACARAKRAGDGQVFLPVRLHIFERTLSGLWACCDRNCRERPKDELADWNFGKIFLDPCEFCDACGSPVLEVRICQACGTETLAAEEADTPTGTGRRLRAPTPEVADDDFSLELDLPDPGDDGAPEPEPTAALRMARWIFSNGAPRAARLAVRRKTGEILDSPAPDSVMLSALDADFGANCPTCGEPSHEHPVVRPFRVGPSFMLGAGVPVALGAVSPDRASSEKPFSGRRLLTFTDARQGTARLSAKLQADAERAFVRAFVYHAVQSKPPGGSAEEIAKKRATVSELERIGSPMLADTLAIARAELAALEGRSEPSPIAWNDTRDRLAQDTALLAIKEVWDSRVLQARTDVFENPGEFAHFLLLREFLRRAVRGNSAETMGLARLLLPQHQDSAEPPTPARALGLSGGDWRDLLSLIVTHFLRLNTIVSVAPSAFNWIDRRPTHIAIGQFDQRSATHDPWPAARGAAGRPSRIVSLLAQAAGVSLDDRSARELINETLDQARQSLSRYFESVQGGGFRLDMRRLSLAKVKTAWLCPVTRRVVDTTLKGFSPYPKDGRHLPTTAIALPDHPFPFLVHPSGPMAASAEIEAFLASDPEVSNLRDLGVWTEFHDRAALFTPYFRSAEHSAQQPSNRLRSYEDMFKTGDINVLNCSTTMEMGVDIGAIELVVNSNVPPSIASYRQRVGRAGRRDQPIAVGLTICKERPLDRRAFDDPARYLNSLLRPPRVRLDSPAIARRHANAFLLSAFLRSRADDALHATIGQFFGFETPPEVTAPWRDFLHWCDATEARLAEHGEALAAVLSGTPVAPDRSLFESARDALTRIEEERRAEWQALTQQEAGVAADNKPALNAIRFQKRRASEAYLLSELAAEGFLPGYGFPSGIVPLVTNEGMRQRQQEQRRPDLYARSRDYPSRQLDIALFEYAPGTTLVLDGLVYVSAGITLNWHGPASADGVREIQALRTAWRCRACGAAGVTSTAARPDACAMCGSPNLDCHDHIAPKGFAVDIRKKPHDDTVQVSYFPRNPPWVHASGASWLALPDGGRVRASPHGIVYLSNSGENGYGYAVCLQCGRAAAESEPQAAAWPLPPALAGDRGGHRPLRGAPRDEHGICPGSAGSFSIRRNLELGHALRTAVVEAQLYGCRDADTARAIAVALREACAIELGIEADEMGFAATPALTPEGTEVWCAVVYDRASGGAGFASTIADEPIRCLKTARDLLDCAGPGGCGQAEAERFCSRCLLSADTQHVIERCDRFTAFQVLDDLIPRLEIAAEDRLFGAETELESMPLAGALTRRIAQPPAKTVVLWLHDEAQDWEFDEWPARTFCETWGPRGVPIRFAVRSGALRLADLSVRQSLARLVQRCQNAELVQSIDAERPGAPLAALLDSGRALVWASRDGSAAQTRADWGRSPIAPVVRGFADGPLFGDKIDVATLLYSPPETAVVEIAGSVDGTASGFGQRLRRALKAQAGDLLRSITDGGLTEVIYTDRYVFSPLSALLVAELVGAFVRHVRASIAVRTRRASKSVRATPPWQVQHDWTTQSDRVAVVHKLLARFCEKARVDLDDATPHRRTLVLKSETCAIELTLDQGVGPWQPADRYRFDFGRAPEEQAQALLKSPIRVTNPGPATFVVIRKLSGA
jgi:DEAD/DEAH box helicase domain-containing protein